MTRPYYLELLVKYRCQTASEWQENLGLQATNALQSAALGQMTKDRVRHDRSMSGDERKGKLPVSYTHLTLPTICSG